MRNGLALKRLNFLAILSTYCAVIARLLPLLLLTIAAQPCLAASSVLYKCSGKNGEIAYVSSKVGYSSCTSVRTYYDAKAAAKPVSTPALGKPAAPPAAAKTVEFRTASGGAAPAAVADPSGKAKVTRGAVYRYVKDGVTHYTNRRPAGRAEVVFSYTETCFACSARPGLDFSNVALNTAAFADEVRLASLDAGVDEALVRAIIHAESAFNPNALSNKGAQGLMQLIPATADRFGVSEPFTPAENIRGGTTYLAWLLKRFNGDSRLASAGYNAGEGAVDRYGGVPPYEETQRYVERVAVLHERYRVALAGAPAVAAGAGVGAGQK